MAALELRIISELFRSRDMLSVKNAGFNADHLSGEPEAAQIFEFIRKWYFHPNTSREFPSIQAIKKRWPSFRLTGQKADEGRLRSLMEECKGLSLEQDARAMVDYFYEMVEDDTLETQEAITVMQSQLSRLSYRNNMSSGFSVREVADTVREQYAGAQTGAIYGIPWPWDSLTRDTLGKNPEDFIILYGRMKSMKTWILLKSAMDDFIIHKKRVLVWSREMNRRKMALRSGSILGGVDYQCLKKGTLPSPLYAQAQQSLDFMAKKMEANEETLRAIKNKEYDLQDVPDLLFVSGRGAPLQLEQIDGIVQSFSPDIVYLDSMYHLDTAAGQKSRSETERQRHLAVGVKQCAINWNVPIVGAIQGNREAEKTTGETMADIGWSDAFAQEGDLILRVNYMKGPNPFEDDYEGHWATLKGKMGTSQESAERRRGKKRLRLGMSNQARKQFSRTDKVPGKIKKKIRELLPKEDRESAMIYLMLSGNRDGVLEGIQFRCIPGYCYEHIQDVTLDEVKKIFNPEKEKKTKSKRRRTSQEIEPAKAGMSWAEKEE